MPASWAMCLTVKSSRMPAALERPKMAQPMAYTVVDLIDRPPTVKTLLGAGLTAIASSSR